MLMQKASTCSSCMLRGRRGGGDRCDMRIRRCIYAKRQSGETGVPPGRRFIAPILIKSNPTMAQYVTQSGTIMVELDRALYVCIESARLWFDELLSTLKSMYCFANDCDPCIMTRYSEGVRTTVVIYTDDHLISSRKLLHMEFLHWTKM